MRRIGVLLNPHARGNRVARRTADGLRRRIGGRGVVIETRRLADLPDAMRAFRRDGVDAVAVCGGDGSLSRALTAAVAEWKEDSLPEWIVLRAGTVNVVADAVGSPSGSPEAVLETLREWPDALRPAARSPLAVAARGPSCRDSLSLGFLFGFGVAVRFLETYYESRDPNAWAAAALVARVAASAATGGDLASRIFAGTPARVTLDGETEERREWSLFLAMAIDRLPLGFRVAPEADREHGRFRVLAGAPAPFDVVRNLPRFHRGSPVEIDGFVDQGCASAVVELESPQPFMLDAEIHEPVDRLEIAAGPRFRFLVAATGGMG